jgi:hypothetical protein
MEKDYQQIIEDKYNTQIELRDKIETTILENIRNNKDVRKVDMDRVYALTQQLNILEEILKVEPIKFGGVSGLCI